MASLIVNNYWTQVKQNYLEMFAFNCKLDVPLKYFAITLTLIFNPVLLQSGFRNVCRLPIADFWLVNFYYNPTPLPPHRRLTSDWPLTSLDTPVFHRELEICITKPLSPEVPSGIFLYSWLMGCGFPYIVLKQIWAKCIHVQHFDLDGKCYILLSLPQLNLITCSQLAWQLR